jgi:hypothetical protein
VGVRSPSLNLRVRLVTVPFGGCHGRFHEVVHLA